MIDKYNIMPNDRLFENIFYACEQANNIDKALEIRQRWKHEWINVRQQSPSLTRLLKICSKLRDWQQCINIYQSCVLSKNDGYTSDPKNNPNDLNASIIHQESTHKVLPTIAIFNQLIRCAARDMSKKYLQLIENYCHNDDNKKENFFLSQKNLENIEKYSENSENSGNFRREKCKLENELIARIEFIESEMIRFRFGPVDGTWLFLFYCGAITQSKLFVNRIINQYVVYLISKFHFKVDKKEIADNENFWKSILFLNNENENSSSNSYLHKRDEIITQISFALLERIIVALYFSNQINDALKLYHIFYKEYGLFTHWFVQDKLKKQQKQQKQQQHHSNNKKDKDKKNNYGNDDSIIAIDFHESGTILAAIAVKYAIENEFQIITDSFNFKLPKMNHNNDDGNINNDTGEDEKVDDELELELALDLENYQEKNLNGNENEMRSNKKVRDLLVITGRGLGSKSGKCVLQPWLKLFLLNKFNPPIKSYTHPRNQGILIVDANDIQNYLNTMK